MRGNSTKSWEDWDVVYLILNLGVFSTKPSSWSIHARENIWIRVGGLIYRKWEERALELTMGWEVVEAQVLDLRLILLHSSTLILFSIFFFFFLTLVHPFLPLFFLLERECEREMRRGWVEPRIWCCEISPTRADMWAMSYSGWQLTSHSICYLYMFIRWSDVRNGSSSSF